MKIFKTLAFYFIFIILVFLFWLVLAIITVLMGEATGVKPTIVILGIFSTKLAWRMAWKLTKKTRGGRND
ncbi:unnamed protein product [marine sediment metagenome]|uniref:Uncharacterized protein n=1 Tax=marine sediment metagenome TaxID=412755 RepID=X0WEH3_9ZZZZ